MVTRDQSPAALGEAPPTARETRVRLPPPPPRGLPAILKISSRNSAAPRPLAGALSLVDHEPSGACASAASSSANSSRRSQAGRPHLRGPFTKHSPGSRRRSARPAQDLGQVRPHRHRLRRRNPSPARVAVRIPADCRRRTSDDQPQRLAEHLLSVTPSPTSNEHRRVHPCVWPWPRLAQYVSVLEELPAPTPISPGAGLLGLDEVGVDAITDLVSHPPHQLSPFASARHRR